MHSIHVGTVSKKYLNLTRTENVHNYNTRNAANSNFYQLAMAWGRIFILRRTQAMAWDPKWYKATIQALFQNKIQSKITKLHLKLLNKI